MASITPPLPSVEHPPSTHKRTYQACIPCRRRKVRCDLGPVDNPHDPPCVRCRREKKDCFFTETRRKRKAEDEGERDLSDDFVARNRRSTLHRPAFREEGLSGSRDESPEYELYDQAQGDVRERGATEKTRASLQLSTATSWKSSTKGTKTTPEGREVTNETAAALFKSPIHNPGDALHLLVDAVARSGDLDRQRNQGQPNTLEPDGRLSQTLHKASGVASGRDASAIAIDPAIANATGSDGGLEAEGLKDALHAWSRFRFVRAGWMTAREAISYLDYFYVNLAPLTPIVPPSYHALSSHARLLTEEPVLTITLLTITSRYMILRGPAGQSRSFLIHERLWKFLRGMITRMFWGQEQFGGGFCGAGTAGTEQRPGVVKGGLRSLGTIESLLLLSDWHPRSMHFPPGDDGDDIIMPLLAETEDNEPLGPTLSGSPYLTWTEPALRSDKMCWSLVGFAYTLSYELGIFNSLIENGRWYPLPKTSHDGHRANCIGRLLHIYVSQTCGRLGYPNIMPHEATDTNIDFLKMDSSNEPSGISEYERKAENVQRAWAEITALMRQSNAEMFESKSLTREKIQNGEYLQFLQAYWPKLREWLDKFESIDIPPLSKTLLMMEYEYTRTYINSLSLQAVLEQCANISDETATSAAGSGNVKGGHTPPALLSSKIVELYKENAVYIAEVVDASRNLLRHVVQGLVPRNGLKHAPVRTYFRILSGAMFLLKTFALGAKEEEVAKSLQLLEDTVKVLRKNVVDDVHLILRIADLLDGLTSSIRTKFVRLAVHGRNNNKKPTSSPRKPAQASSKTAKPTTPTTDNTRFANTRPPDPDSNKVNLDFLRTQGPLAGISTNLVDPNDSTITIMPPPDYIYTVPYPQADNNSPQMYTNSLSPHQQYSNAQQPHQQFSPSQQDFQQQQQLQQNGGMFAPSNTDYDWLTLDVNPLLQQGQGGGGQSMGMGSWVGAFGPDIGESLEMLGMLTDPGQYGLGGGGEEGMGSW